MVPCIVIRKNAFSPNSDTCCVSNCHRSPRFTGQTDRAEAKQAHTHAEHRSGKERVSGGILFSRLHPKLIRSKGKVSSMHSQNETGDNHVTLASRSNLTHHIHRLRTSPKRKSERQSTSRFMMMQREMHWYSSVGWKKEYSMHYRTST